MELTTAELTSFIEQCRIHQPKLTSYYESIKDVTSKQQLLQQLLSFPPHEWTPHFIKAQQASHKQINSTSIHPPNVVQPTLQNGAPCIPHNNAPAVLVKREDMNEDVLEMFRLKGLQLIGSEKVCVVIMAAGQSTRLGSDVVKGCTPVTKVSNKSLFQILSERIIRLLHWSQSIDSTNTTQQTTLPSCPVYIMTSSQTDEVTKQHFKENQYFNLNQNDVYFFQQSVAPCFDMSGNYLLTSPSTIAMSPDGNGSVFKALEEAGILEDMKKRDLKYVHIVGIDNLLCKIMDPTFFGYMWYAQAEVGNKCIQKEEAKESVGVFCIQTRDEEGGKAYATVIEYGEVPNSMLNKRNADDSLTFGCGNICNHMFSVQSIENINKKNWRKYHLAHKMMKEFDMKQNDVITPKTKNAYKLESFIFDAFEVENFVAGIEVLREYEFAPIKNATGVDSIESAQKLLSELHKVWLTNAEVGFIANDDTSYKFVEVDPLVSYEGEDLHKHFNGIVPSLPYHFTLKK